MSYTNFVQVSSSCTSVYADGSETRGAIAARISVKYGSVETETAVRVWMPQFPLNVSCHILLVFSNIFAKFPL